jgi:hypothetical protein
MLLLIPALISLFCFGQDISGVWKGKILQEDREFYYEIRVDTVHKDGFVKGTTYILEEKSGNYGTIAFTGTFKKQKLHFRESKIIKEDKSSEDGYYKEQFYWCIKKGDLSFHEKNGIMTLNGPWTAEGTCPPGTISSSKKSSKKEEKNSSTADCMKGQSADFMLGIWTGMFKQYSCNVNHTSPIVLLIDKVEGNKFWGIFIWTGMKHARDSRSTLEGEIKNGRVFFYENELISGGGLVLNGIYENDVLACDSLFGIWRLDKYQSACDQPNILKDGGRYTVKKQAVPTIYFDTNSSVLNPTEKAKLDVFAAWLKQLSTIRLTLSGHTDNTGSSARNMILSKERAKVVMDYLNAQFYYKNRIKYSYHAHVNPAESNKTKEGQQLNRRTEIKIVSGK